MEIEYRKLSEKELDVFIEMRINQLREEGAKEDIRLKACINGLLYAPYEGWYICFVDCCR